MKFNPIYYICIACPTVERTLEMVDRYVEHGARAFQIDMPSNDPFDETEFVKAMMKESLDEVNNYSHYMDGIREIRRRHPDLELHVVVYADVVDAIGIDNFIAFGKEIGVASYMIPGLSMENHRYIEEHGIRVFRFVAHEMDPEDVKFCAQGDENEYICIRNQKPGEIGRPGLQTWDEKYIYMREHGVKGKIYSVFGIKTKETLQNVKDSGADGAIIGNVLMHLWGDEEKLWALLSDFQSLAE